jgi:hypothetical protein
MTGVYFRVKRGNKWVNKEIEYLTSEERRELLANWDHDSLVNTINHLCHAVDLLTEEDDEEVEDE